jgi:hypothetical protein
LVRTAARKLRSRSGEKEIWRTLAKRAGHKDGGNALGEWCRRHARAPSAQVLELARARAIDATLVTKFSPMGPRGRDLVQMLDHPHGRKVSVLTQMRFSSAEHRWWQAGRGRARPDLGSKSGLAAARARGVKLGLPSAPGAQGGSGHRSIAERPCARSSQKTNCKRRSCSRIASFWSSARKASGRGAASSSSPT